ncbi:MAG: PQQ-binding-like beta-propeller repeat protein [Planctomycetes bacterium]|nr:PQQ-binding-like beta-propeller repeat protein [Planctomycetota bacterium]
MRGAFASCLLAAASCAAPQGPPIDWSLEKGKERNVAWSAGLGSFSFGSPVVSGGLVWVGTNNETPRDPACKVDASVLMAFRERDGRFLWQHASPRRKEFYRHGDWGRFPLRCTPLVEGDRLWFVNNCWEAICLDIGQLRRGECVAIELWRTDLIERTGAWPQVLGMGFGIALSIGPSLQGRIYVSTGNGLDWKTQKPARPDAPAFVCLDMNSGEVIGRERSGISARTRTANWSSPVTASVGGRALILFGGGDGFLYAFDPVPSESGTLRELWRADCRRSEGEASAIASRPVVHQGRVYVALGEDGDTQGPGNLVCVDLATGRRIWNSPDFSLTLSTPLIHEGRLIAASGEGIVHCFDAASGKKIWEYDSLSLIVSSPILADGRVYLSNSDDELLIVDVRAPDRQPVVLKREAAGCGLSTPQFADGTLYVAGGRRLYAIREGEPGAPAPSTEAAKRGRAADALHLPTPGDVVTKLLELAALKESDLLYDLGSGDGRIVIAAVRDFKCRSVGVEIGRDLVERSREGIRGAHLEERARIEHEDLLKADFSRATVVVLYVGDRLNRLLLPKLKELAPGSRIVSHEFAIPGLSPERVVKVPSREDQRDHTLYLYAIRPR